MTNISGILSKNRFSMVAVLDGASVDWFRGALAAQRLSVSEGSSPKVSRYTAENRLRWANPHRVATSAMVVVTGVAA